VSFTFRYALIFVDTYAHTLFLEVNFVFHSSSQIVPPSEPEINFSQIMEA
jgi:hypothetical protein